MNPQSLFDVEVCCNDGAGADSHSYLLEFNGIESVLSCCGWAGRSGVCHRRISLGDP